MSEQILSYAARGWKVFPVYEPVGGVCSCPKGAACDSPAKHPRTEHGHNDASDKAAMVTFWAAKYRGTNWGIVTGAASGFIVVDVDAHAGGTDSLKRLLAEYGPLDQKYFVRTGGGGWHLLFKHPGFYVKTTNSKQKAEPAFGPGIDIKGDGGYIVAPPSGHVSGGVYAWGESLPDEIPDAPEWLKRKLQENTGGAAVTLNEGTDKIPEGGRNNVLTSIAGTNRRRGLDAAEIYALLSVVNERRCEPPLPDGDIRKIAYSVARYSPDDPLCVFPEKTVMDGERPEGVYFVSEFADRVRKLYRAGLPGGVSTGIPSLDWHYTVKLGQFTVVTGIPTHGKTAVLDCILHNLASLHEWKVAVTSIENQPLERHAAQLLSIYMGKPFGKGDVVRMTEAEMDEGLEWLAEHFVFVLPEDGRRTVSGILDCIDWVDSTDFKVQGVVIDPWNELEHRRPANMTETEFVSQSLTRLRGYGRQKEKHMWLVAHPTKLQKDVRTGSYPVPTLYDISGSAHFRNKCDVGLSVWRDVLQEGSATEVHVQKVRFRECGRPGKVELYFDATNGRFTDTRPVYFTETVEEEESKW